MVPEAAAVSRDKRHCLARVGAAIQRVVDVGRHVAGAELLAAARLVQGDERLGVDLRQHQRAPLAGALLPQVEQKYRTRFFIGAGYPNTYYFFLNVTVPPFNKLAARQAVNYAIDSRALVRIFGGRLHPTCNLIPPGMVGFDQAGNVASVDRTGKELVMNVSPSKRSTPTLGRQRSFFEELFGNIGTVGSAGLPGSKQ